MRCYGLPRVVLALLLSAYVLDCACVVQQRREEYGGWRVECLLVDVEQTVGVSCWVDCSTAGQALWGP
jgi:hypothetical protein